jgi:hypothetical protein
LAAGGEIVSPPAAARLIDDFRDPACVLDHEGVPLAGNDAGVTYAACLTPGQPGPFTDLLGRAIECSGVVSGEIPCPGGDGVLSLDVTILPVLGDGAWLALFTDRTLDNNLRAALAESRQRYKDLVEISSDFGWETGPDGTFVFISPGGALGHDASRLIGGPRNLSAIRRITHLCLSCATSGLRCGSVASMAVRPACWFLLCPCVRRMADILAPVVCAGTSAGNGNRRLICPERAIESS